MRKTIFTESAFLLCFILLVQLSIRPLSSASTRDNREPKIYRDKIDPHWFDDNKKFWYRLDLADGKREFILVNAETGIRSPAFDYSRVAKVLSERMATEIDPEKLPVDTLSFSGDGKAISLFHGEEGWKFDLFTYSATSTNTGRVDKAEIRSEERRRGRAASRIAIKSPNEKFEVLVRGDNLVLRDASGKNEHPLSYDGNPGASYARNSQRERFVEMDYDAIESKDKIPEIYWSPDSKYFVAMRYEPGAQRNVYLIESSPKDQLQPKLESYPYLKPGDKIPVSKPHLFNVESAREIPVEEALFANPWSISDVRWDKDSSRFTFLFNQRGHQIMRILAVDAHTGSVRPLIDEQSPTFIDYSGKFFCDYLDESSEIIWMSERDGWNHLYLYDSRAGTLKNQITRGGWVVRKVERIDKEKRQIWFQAGGVYPGQDPYYIHYCRVNFDGTGLVILTAGDGTHSLQFSPDQRFFLDTWSRIDFPPVIELRHADDGKLSCRLEQADVSELTTAHRNPPERFVAKGRDGMTDIFGVIFRPNNFDPAKKYPVIENIYAGPHDSYVPKSFHAAYWNEKLADRGFLVVQVDGMGTSNRSKKFHDVCWKNIGDAGFPDRILWMKAAAAKYSSFDLSRVGIYGTSAGGQNALDGLLTHPDFYKAGVADSGCHDNRMDKIWWNEQWMGWPVGPHYEEQSNVTMAHLLQGKLLLMAGEMDKNVDPSSTMQVVDALIKANKDFELLIVPGAGHGVARTPYGWHRIEDFFTRHLKDEK